MHIFDRKAEFNDNPFHIPDESVQTFERHISSDADNEGNVWCALRSETDGKSLICLFRLGSSQKKYILSDCPDASVKPVVCAGGDGRIYAAWAEYDAGSWRIAAASLEPQSDEIKKFEVYKSEHAAFHTAVCWHQGALQVAWSDLDPETGRMVIYLSCVGNAAAAAPVKLAGGDFDAFRPVIVSGGDRMLAAFDLGREGIYEIAWLYVNDNNSIGEISFLSAKNERWMRPDAVYDGHGAFYMTFIAVRDVTDAEHDIIDHDVGAVCAVIENSICRLLPDEKTNDEVLCARLREGLLGKDRYVAYFGSRRKVTPAVLPDGSVWIVWELRFEKDRRVIRDRRQAGTLHSIEHYGWLAGKRLADGAWSDTMLLHEGGTLYSIARNQYDRRLCAAYIQQSDILSEQSVCAIQLDTDSAEILNEGDTSVWDRWSPFKSAETDKKRYSAVSHGEEYNLYWADTHSHSNLSPDAEGEADELILFARDIAGIDAMAIVDNDYYPHKALTKGEWQLHQELSKLFTKEGSFVVFPGYEYTFHNEKLDPDFNHRYVLYPKAGGGLFRRTDKGSRTVEELAEKLKETDALMFAHHTAWKLTDSEKDRNVEVCSSWRVCIEEKDMIIKRLKAGDRFCFIGSSDTHRSVPGLGGALTGIYAKALDPGSLFEAYRNRRTIATQGLRTSIDFSVNDIFIGGEGVIEGPPEIKLKVSCEKPLEFVEVIRDGEVCRRIEEPGAEVSYSFTDTSAEAGNHFYFVRAKAVGDPSFNEYGGDRSHYNVFIFDEGIYRFNFARARGPFAWSTPVWIDIRKGQL